MKTFKLIAIFLIPVTLFISCTDEEDTGIPRQVTKTYTYSQDLRGSEGVRGELPLDMVTLSEVIGNEPANNLRNAELQLADSYLEIKGLSQIERPDSVAVILEDFTIKVGSRQAVNLGDCSTDPQGVNEFAADVELSTNQIINLIQNVFTDVTTGNQTANITVSFTPSINITSTDNVELLISFGGIYYYLEYEQI